jgi:signal transduction histidine kinase
MYARARRRLTAWIALTVLVVLLALGLGTYGGLVWALDREVDAGIRAVVDSWRTDAPPLERLEPLDLERHFEDETADVFLIVFRSDGQLVANPAGLEVDELVTPSLLAAGLRGDEAWATVEEHGRFRLLAAPVEQRDGIAGVVIGGRSLDARDTSVRAIVGVLGVVAASGFVLAIGAAYVLAGRAMAPLELAYERERAFVADASHELRSPLTLLRALGELFQRGNLDADQRATVDQLVGVTDEASTLVDDLLVLARSERPPAGDPDSLERDDLAETAREVVEEMRPLLDAHGTEVDLRLAPAPARIPPVEARRILRPLLDNIVAHTPPGTGARVETGLDGGSAVLVVADDGRGVAADRLERIFDRFEQGDRARTPGAAGGAGLGLAIVRALVERRGGATSAQAEPGGGLEVTVRLPASQPRSGPRAS